MPEGRRVGTQLGTAPPALGLPLPTGSPRGSGGAGTARRSARPWGALVLPPLGSSPFPRHVNLFFYVKKRENMIKIQMSLKALLLL